jgi:multidrug transporter EmrE-like cation transporter
VEPYRAGRNGGTARNPAGTSLDDPLMLSFRTIACIIGFVISQTGAYLCLRLASQRSGLQLYGMFLLGTSIGFGSPVCLTLALKNANPNLIYAFCIGGAFFVLQFASSIIFRQPLSGIQWTGILIIGLGLILVQLKSVGIG